MSLQLDHEEDYASSEDSDFAPETGTGAESPSPSDDDEENPKQTIPATKGARKRPADAEEAEDAGFENSGDEALIEKAKKKKRRKTKGKGGEAGGVGDDDADEGGEGGLIKTRSMRAQEKTERTYTAANGPVTIDVDALWAEMMGLAPATSEKPAGKAAIGNAISTDVSQAAPGDHARPDEDTTVQGREEPSEMIRIKRTYNFAGKVHSEEKLVPRDSAEAKLYLASLGENADASGNQDSSRRMPRRAFRSAFEPLTDQLLQQHRRADLNLGMGARLKAREEAGTKKLNTIEKSRMDWAGYVDKAGIKDELEVASKSKYSFAARQDFLARSEAVREEDARRARITGRA